MVNLTNVSSNELVTSARQNLINEYIEFGTHRVNTLSLDIGGSEVINSSGMMDYVHLFNVPAFLLISDFNTYFDNRLATKTTDNLTEGLSNLYDKILSLTEGSGINITGTYPSFTITNTGVITESDPLSLHLDQTTPQAVVNGSPIMEGIQFDTTPSTTNSAEGLLRWNSTDGTLDLGMSGGDITQQIGQELFVKVRNESGYETISNGQVVYISGRTGVYPDVRKARSDDESTSCVLGIATQDIESPAFGYITTFGYVRGIKTNYTGDGIWGTTWVTGDLLYVSKTDAGVLTNVEPNAPHHSDIVGFVGIISSNQGTILVNIVKHKTLSELTDVNGTPLSTTGQIPVWNNTAGYFDFDYNISNYELLSNKSTNVVTDGSSDTKYPSVKAIKDYADGLVVGLLDYRGSYNASGNVYPSTGGSGTGGDILKGDMWIISVAGTLGGTPIHVGDSIISNVDSPGQTLSNWNTLNTNIGYVPEDSANKVTSISGSSTDTQYPSAKLLYDQLALKLDEKVKYNIDDSSSGFLSDKTVAGTGISLSEGTGGDTDKLKITNSAPDQTVSFTGGTNVTIGGTYPSFTITDNSASSSGYVPYTGATTDVDLGEFNLTASKLTALYTSSGSNWIFSGDYDNDGTGKAIAEGQFYDPNTNDGGLGQISLRNMDTGVYGGMSLTGANFYDPNNRDKLLFFATAGNGIEFQNRVSSPTSFTGATKYDFDGLVNVNGANAQGYTMLLNAGIGTLGYTATQWRNDLDDPANSFQMGITNSDTTFYSSISEGFIGMTGNQDLNFITNNLARVIITKDGYFQNKYVDDFDSGVSGISTDQANGQRFVVSGYYPRMELIGRGDSGSFRFGFDDGINPQVTNWEIGCGADGHFRFYNYEFLGQTAFQIFQDTNNIIFGSTELYTAGNNAKFEINYLNDDYNNIDGAGSHILMTNPDGTQNVIISSVGGVVRAKWRTDNEGNVNWVSYGANVNNGHYFFVNGDYGDGGDIALNIDGNMDAKFHGNVSIGETLTSQFSTAALTINNPLLPGFLIKAGGPAQPTMMIMQYDYDIDNGPSAVRSVWHMENDQCYMNVYDDYNSVYAPMSIDASKINLNTNGGGSVLIGSGADDTAGVFGMPMALAVASNTRIGGMTFNPASSVDENDIMYIVQETNGFGASYGSVMAFYSNSINSAGASTIELGFDGGYWSNVYWSANGMAGSPNDVFGGTKDTGKWFLDNNLGQARFNFTDVDTGNVITTWAGNNLDIPLWMGISSQGFVFDQYSATSDLHTRSGLVVSQDADNTIMEFGVNAPQFQPTDEAYGTNTNLAYGLFRFDLRPAYGQYFAVIANDNQGSGDMYPIQVGLTTGNTIIGQTAFQQWTDNGERLQIIGNSYLFNATTGSTAQFVICDSGYAVTSYEPASDSARAFIFGFYPDEFTSQGFDQVYMGFNSGTSIRINNTATGEIKHTAGLHIFTGGILHNVTQVTNTYNILTSDYLIIGDKTTAFTMTLPTAQVGQTFEIKNVNTGIVTVDGAGSDTIDDALTIDLEQWEGVTLMCYSANKWVIV